MTDENPKLQTPSSREAPNTKLQKQFFLDFATFDHCHLNTAQVIGARAETRYWDLELGASLVLGAWCLELGHSPVFGAWSLELP